MEQPLARNAACLLGAINLSAYVLCPFTDKACIDFESLSRDIKIYYRALDSLVDKGMKLHALKEQQQMAQDFRNIGLGTMGWADMFIKLGLVYGNEASQMITESVAKFLAQECLVLNMKLGFELGDFPKKKNLPIYEESNFAQTLFVKPIKLPHLRNCSMLTVAPTGSISTMLNISSGIEPNFRLKYKRKTIAINGQPKVYDIEAGIVQQYREATNNYTSLPKYFVSSDEVDWKSRLTIQAIIQQYTDSGISSTLNLPKGTTSKTIEQIYLTAWQLGLKGVTVYVDGSRDGILFTEDSSTEMYASKVYKRPKELNAELYFTNVKGKMFVVVIGLLNNKPYELFAYPVKDDANLNITKTFLKGKIVKIKRGEYQFNSPELVINNLELTMEAIEERATTILSSMLLRHNVDIEQIVKTLKKVNPIISSFTAAVCRILNKYIKERTIVNVCPDCGAKLVYTDGCEHCSECEYSKCMLIYKERG